jgi:predicted transposase/invertase (TIGR01784 family)
MVYGDFTEFTPEVEEEFYEAERSGVLPTEIDRFGDRFLKYLLTTPERKSILLDLANATLQAVEHEPLADIKMMDREMTPNVDYGRGLRLDYYGTTVSGKHLNMEFQKYGGEDFIKRALFCTSSIIERQVLKGEDFGKLRQTIFIGLLKFDLFPWDGWCWDFVLSNIKKKKILTNDLLLIFVEMEKLGGVLSALREEQKRGKLDKSDALTRLALWGGYMTGMGVDIVTELMAQDEVFSQVIKAEQDFWDDKRNRFMQWRDEKRERDAVWQLYNAERRGKEIGRVEGKAESKLEFAQAMLADGMSLDLISKYTGLTVKEIEEQR